MRLKVANRWWQKLKPEFIEPTPKSDPESDWPELIKLEYQKERPDYERIGFNAAYSTRRWSSRNVPTEEERRTFGEVGAWIASKEKEPENWGRWGEVGIPHVWANAREEQIGTAILRGMRRGQIAAQETGAPSYSGIDKDECEKLIKEGRIAEVPESYEDYLIATDKSRYEEVRQERKFQKEHTAEEYQADIKQRQEKATIIGEKTTEAEKQIADYWDWIKGGKQGPEPAKDLLAPSIPSTRNEAGKIGRAHV